MVAAAASTPARPFVGLKESSRPRSPYDAVVNAPVVEPARNRDSDDQRLPKITLMPRRVVVGVIGLVIMILGVGLLFGS